MLKDIVYALCLKTVKSVVIYNACLYFLLLIAGCSKESAEEVVFSKKALGYDLVVEGGINSLQRTQFIKLSSPSFHPDSVPKPINNAEVSVNDGVRETLFRLSSTPGIYSGIVLNQRYNQPYTLKIKYQGREYSAVDTLLQVVNIVDDFIPFSIFRYPDNSLEINIPKHTFGFLSSSKWHISYKGQPGWNPAKLDSSTLYSYTHSFGAPNSIYPLLNQKRKDPITSNDFVTLYKFSLSDSYSRYLYSIFLETDWRGIFSGVPGRIKGNVTGGALGYFYATDVDMRRYKVNELIQ